MKFVNLGKSDLRVTSVCLGTMTFGQQNSEAEAHEQLDYAFAQGINFIDTAEMYPVPPKAETTGATERIIGTWLKHQARDRVVLATKAAGAGRIDWIRDGTLTFDRKNLRAAVESSLARLQTDYIDLYQLHWPDRNVPTFGQYQFEPEKERAFVSFLETLQALDELVKEGKIRHIGLSNETPWGVMQFLQTAQAHGLPRIVSIQNAYSLLNRTWELGLANTPATTPAIVSRCRCWRIRPWHLVFCRASIWLIPRRRAVQPCLALLPSGTRKLTCPQRLLLMLSWLAVTT